MDEHQKMCDDIKMNVDCLNAIAKASANSRCPASTGSAITDAQRMDWLLRECEIMQLDENGARFGQDLMSRDEIDAAILSQNNLLE